MRSSRAEDKPPVMILGAEFDGFRFTTVRRHITGSCWRFTKVVCPSAEAPPRDGADRLAWGETFSQAVEHLPQRSLELRDSLRAG